MRGIVDALDEDIGVVEDGLVVAGSCAVCASAGMARAARMRARMFIWIIG
jgi:hypothetical protein